MSDQPISENVVRIRTLTAGDSHAFALTPDAGARAALAGDLGIPAIRKLRFVGTLIPQGRADWRLEAMLGATVVQDCVATLAPVSTRIDVPVMRIYMADPPPVPEADEVEMTEDDSIEPLGATLDLGAVMAESLALALPDYPHAKGVAPLVQTFAEPGSAPLGDDERRPFAGLAGLRDSLAKNDDKG